MEPRRLLQLAEHLEHLALELRRAHTVPPDRHFGAERAAELAHDDYIEFALELRQLAAQLGRPAWD